MRKPLTFGVRDLLWLVLVLGIVFAWGHDQKQRNRVIQDLTEGYSSSIVDLAKHCAGEEQRRLKAEAELQKLRQKTK